MKTLRRILSVVVIIALVGCIGYIGWDKIQSAKQAPEVITNDIQGTINDIGELATAEYDFKITQTMKKPEKEIVGFKIPFTATTVLYSYSGTIKAGIEFSNIAIDVKETEHKIYIKMPETEILSSEVNPSSLELYDENYSPFNPLNWSDVNLSIETLKQTAQDTAIQNGLLVKASENAQQIIRSTVGSMYDLDEYEIEFY